VDATYYKWIMRYGVKFKTEQRMFGWMSSLYGKEVEEEGVKKMDNFMNGGAKPGKFSRS